MFIGRFFIQGRELYGLTVPEDNTVCELEGPEPGAPKTGRTFSIGDARILAPCLPTKIVCVGLNYRSHAQELDLPLPEEPVIFLKPPSAVIAHNTPILLPPASKRVDYEGEMAVVIGKTAANIRASEAPKHILGFTCANDVTARDLQQKDGQWTRAKSFDTFLPLGPYINTELDSSELDLALYVNGQRRQQSNTRDLIFSVNELVGFISGIMTLFPGDVILTGTPSGIGPLQQGDRVRVEIEGIGKLENPVIR